MNNKKLSVLVVDDSALITERLSALVRELEYVGEVFIAIDFAEALMAIDNRRPEVVLLDIHLPHKSGIDLLNYIRSNYPSVKVMMVSNKASGYYRDLCKAAGAHHFIDKTKEFEKIPAILESFR